MNIQDIAAEMWKQAKKEPAHRWIKIEGYKIAVLCARSVCDQGCHVRYTFIMNHQSGMLSVPHVLMRKIREVFLPNGIMYPGENGELIQYVQEVRVPTDREIRLSLAALPLPPPSGQDYRASGDANCPICGFLIRLHPMDPNELSYDKQPFLHVLCNGDRVKT